MPAQNLFYVGIKSIQYTIRKVPAALDQRLRATAGKESKSLNSLIIETLEKQFLHSGEKTKYTDLNQFSGLWAEDPDFDQAIALFDEVDDNAWK